MCKNKIISENGATKSIQNIIKATKICFDFNSVDVVHTP